jgi:carbon-monoxide dehydrogenase medium subunit
MKPAPLSYLRPRSLAEAIAVLEDNDGSARVLAGGQSLVPMLGMRLIRPEVLIDINDLGDELARIDAGAETVVGALVRYRTLEESPVIAERLPLLQGVVRHIGDRQVRNRGTIGGALAQADPTGEIALACLTLGARIVARSARGERIIPIEEFFQGAYHSALEPDELLVAVRFGAAPAHCRFFERGRKHNDFALLSVAVAGDVDADGRWSGVRIGLGGMSDTPVLSRAAAACLDGTTWDAATIARAAQLALEDADPPDDVRASAEYRAHLLPIHLRRLLHDINAPWTT